MIIHLYINERTFIRLWPVSSIWHVLHYRLINFFIFFYCVLILERDEKSVKSRFRLTYFCKATALKFVFSLTLQLTHTLDAVLCDGDSRPPRSFLINAQETRLPSASIYICSYKESYSEANKPRHTWLSSRLLLLGFR